MKVPQPTPRATQTDVERIVRRDFPAEAFATVFSELDRYGAEEWQRERDRVRLASLKLADGEFDQLRIAINLATTDYRDCLLAAEYPRVGAQSFTALDQLSAPEQQRLVDADWREYTEWLKRTD